MLFGQGTVTEYDLIAPFLGHHLCYYIHERRKLIRRFPVATKHEGVTEMSNEYTKTDFSFYMSWIDPDCEHILLISDDITGVCPVSYKMHRYIPDSHIATINLAFGDCSSVEMCIDKLRKLTSHIAEKYPDKPISCFARGFGAYIATLFRNAYPGALNKLIMCNPSLKMSEVLPKMLKPSDREKLYNGETTDTDMRPELSAELYESMKRNDAYSAKVTDSASVLIIQGMDDEYVSWSDIRDYAAVNNISFKSMAAMGHSFMGTGHISEIIDITGKYIDDRFMEWTRYHRWD